MIFWLVIAVMAAVPAALIARAIYGGVAAPRSAAAYDVEIYRDQLRELDQDVERGVLSVTDAQTARAEISRKLIAATERRDVAGGVEGVTLRGRRVAALAVLIAVPALAFGLYWREGSPGVPGEPYAGRLTEIEQIKNEAQQISDMIAGFEAKVKADPQDADSWRTLGLAYMTLRRYEDAADSFDRAIKANAPSADLLLNKGVALVFANDGFVTTSAEDTFKAVLELDREEGLSHYFLAVAALQRDDEKDALDHIQSSLAKSPPDAPWLDDARALMAALQAKLEVTAQGNDQTTEETAQPPMVGEMVARLAERLKAEPHDIDGWLMLIKSYSVLGDAKAGQAALASARAEFAADQDALKRIDALAIELQL